ncbi:MAG: formate dehydrogenase accessory sulfurtransferase FdhD [candidate division KSB1 bacterium]|nr:formate dehydrogenase accessory sulfurtransferase FdhD [candidate division KSB1 bacterium]MDZ7276065.1 formate dehydrogenase accessory sulfurtransferase FdhD [candidate division KSB1 bacterium]MDZ7285653.1 formate dehydrogenase accessory sulfurtransferase FdhD [candidate division KSB1 bacterium]MDZ7298685.1 formate dehydrogenase accessory sulfurtransferase FdhD [candidate division KSB1 bacterium]MDZ7308407.1 formate dehydrogenase accessory sulfurtransferase FdhD [candidate division KSB1 bact
MSEAIKTFAVHRLSRGRLHAASDHLVVEEPLEIRLNGRPLAVVMRTPGEDFDLARGFLLSEGLLGSADGRCPPLPDIDWACDEFGLPIPNVVDCSLAALSAGAIAAAQRRFYATSSCGICGRTSLERVFLQAPALQRHFTITAAALNQLPVRLAAAQSHFTRTGGLHAAALFSTAGELVKVCEDIGRHNAVDKALGWALSQGLYPLADFGLLVSGRLSFEMVQKALLAGISLVAAISAASSLAVELAGKTGMALAGFVRGGQAVIYHGHERITR